MKSRCRQTADSQFGVKTSDSSVRQKTKKSFTAWKEKHASANEEKVTSRASAEP